MSFIGGWQKGQEQREALIAALCHMEHHHMLKQCSRSTVLLANAEQVFEVFECMAEALHLLVQHSCQTSECPADASPLTQAAQVVSVLGRQLDFGRPSSSSAVLGHVSVSTI